MENQDQEQIPGLGPQSGTGLAILKGVTWGMGVLLFLGVIMLFFMMSQKSKDLSTGEGAEIAALPPLPITPAEEIVSVSTSDGLILILVEDNAVKAAPTRRVLYLSSQDATSWQILPRGGVNVLEP